VQVTDSADTTERGRSFGEEGARLGYGSYLHISELLGQQQLLSEAHDELLFITIHQAYELWFKELLFELESVRDAMYAGDCYTARHLLQRVAVIEQVLVEQIAILFTMTPQDFMEFRSLLAPASGFQSVQFREMEFISGHKDPAFLRRVPLASEEEKARLQRRLDEPTLWEAFCALMQSRGMDMGSEHTRRDSLLRVARDRSTYGELWDVAEGLLDHDQLCSQWRSRHLDMVERQIGTKSGTGGSSGAPYLRGRLPVRFYPELWELRGYL
jgi:tryptophan 2,3-dioxygenase